MFSKWKGKVSQDEAEKHPGLPLCGQFSWVVIYPFPIGSGDFKSCQYMIRLLRLLYIHSCVFSTGDFVRATKMSLVEHKFRRLPRVSIGSTSPFVERESCSYIRYGRFSFLSGVSWRSLQSR